MNKIVTILLLILSWTVSANQYTTLEARGSNVMLTKPMQSRCTGRYSVEIDTNNSGSEQLTQGWVTLNGKVLPAHIIKVGDSYELISSEADIHIGDIVQGYLIGTGSYTYEAGLNIGTKTVQILEIGGHQRSSTLTCSAHVPTAINIGSIKPGDTTSNFVEVKTKGGFVFLQINHIKDRVVLSGQNGASVIVSGFPVSDDNGNIVWPSNIDKTVELKAITAANSAPGPVAAIGTMFLSCD